MIETVKSIIVEILEDNGKVLTIDVDKSTNLRDLGLTSFDLATLTVRLEDEFNVDVFEEGVVSTIGEIMDVLNKTR